jgi:hypothetical protein
MKKMMVMSIIAVIMTVIMAIGAKVTEAYELQISPGGFVDVSGSTSTFFDVIFDPQGSTVNLGTYTFNMFYDSSELSWNSSASSTSAPSPLIAGLLGPLNGTTGFIGNFNAASFGGDATVSTPVTLAHLVFDVNVAVTDGLPDLWFDTTQNNKFGFSIDGSGELMSSIPINSNLPDVGTAAPPVVPEPVSSILFIVGGATLGFRRFTTRRN